MANALNEPENAITKNIGIMIAGMINAGMRRIRIMPRAVSARNTPKSWAMLDTRWPVVSGDSVITVAATGRAWWRTRATW